MYDVSTSLLPFYIQRHKLQYQQEQNRKQTLKKYPNTLEISTEDTIASLYDEVEDEPSNQCYRD